MGGAGVSNPGYWGIGVRAGPSLTAERTGGGVFPGDVVVGSHVQVVGGVPFLHLADDSGHLSHKVSRSTKDAWVPPYVPQLREGEPWPSHLYEAGVKRLMHMLTLWRDAAGHRTGATARLRWTAQDAAAQAAVAANTPVAAAVVQPDADAAGSALALDHPSRERLVLRAVPRVCQRQGGAFRAPIPRRPR